MIANRDEILDLVAAYAVDALEPEEKLRVDAALDRDPELSRELYSHYDLLATLAEAVDPNPSTPSPLLWERIAAEIEGADEVSPRLASVYDIRSQRRFSKITAALSVAAIGLAAVLAVGVVQMQRDRTADPVAVAIQELLDDPAATVATLTADDATAEARIVLGADGVGYVFADSLPALDSTRTYQLWAIVDDRVISAGVLGSDPEKAPFQVVGNVAGFAITEEVAGGVAVSEVEPVVLWLRNA